MEYYPRIIEEKLDNWMGRREAIIIRGPRQAGKTTLFLHLKDKYGGNYITLEDEESLEIFENDPKMFAEIYRKGKYLFIDEVQYSKKAGKTIKFLHDSYPDLKILATGSGSFDVKVEVGKYLVGRAVYFELLPLSFEEFLLWKDKRLYRIFLNYKQTIICFIEGESIEFSEKDVHFKREFRYLFEEYVTFGRFPAVVKERDKKIKEELLKNLYSTYLEKDVFFFFSIRHLEKFRKFMRYLAFINGGILEISKISRDTGIDYKTLENYLNILINTYIVHLVSPYHKNMTTELRKAKKLYFVDLGLRNAILRNFSPLNSRTDRGRILENFVYNEIKELGEVKYWRTTGKAEVDFILQYKDSLIPIEVKSMGDVGRGFLSFLNVYKPKRAIVFSEKNWGLRRKNETEILYIPYYMI